MWIKICGITRYEDAIIASHLGADAIGLVFTDSPRMVAPKDISSWIHKLNNIEKVGIFTREAPAYIEDVAKGLNLDTIQIHAGLTKDHYMLAKRFKIIYAAADYKNIRVPPIDCRILIDPSMGSGTNACWHDIRNINIPFILAGGLNPDNVKDAIHAASPIGVDVSSGVECSPGIKDPGLIERFIREARS